MSQVSVVAHGITIAAERNGEQSSTDTRLKEERALFL